MNKYPSLPVTILIGNEDEWEEAQAILLKKMGCIWAGRQEHIPYSKGITHINVSLDKRMKFAKHGNYQRYPLLPFSDFSNNRKYKDE